MNYQKNRIDKLFTNLKIKKCPALIAYITAGDPSLSASEKIALALEESGVDLLEIGIPFSDPLADGPVIQAAATRAIASGISIPKILDLISQIRKNSQIPIVLFSYFNPIYSYGFMKFQEDALMVGADGLLVLDLPPQEVDRNGEITTTNMLKSIRLVAPNTSQERLKTIADSAEGFIYYVSREGVTGEQNNLSIDIAERVMAIRAITKIPIAVGFGISNHKQAATVAAFADAVVVGSAIVRRISEIGEIRELPLKIGNFVRPIAEAVHSTTYSIRDF